MGKLAWYLNRLKAMSPREVVWRLRQKRLQHRELARFRVKQPVTSPLYPGVEEQVGRLVSTLDTLPGDGPLGYSPLPDDGCAPGEAVRLLGGYRYEDYATDWHAGFNTPRRWPLQPSYCLEYKQRDDIGDARVNWDLNRHRQFVRLAAAGNAARLEELLDDWAQANPFLWGISWTSPMEIALRSISWMTAARLLAARGEGPGDDGDRRRLVRKLLTGVANMTRYLVDHESGFSSANNHLIVEVAAVLLASLLFGDKKLAAESVGVLDRELARQVSRDGVDLESSLHYHGFVMEAYLLAWRAMKAHGMDVGPVWRDRLDGMARFVAASRVAKGVWCVFGDDDEARISDPGFGDADYFDYLLALYREVSGRDVGDETDTPRVTFPEGGYSFLRGGDMMVGIDHAPLGFGSIAAHGHNDMLSFQLFISGRPVLVDSGTYLYHTDRSRRDMLRSTRMHNTVTIDGKEQSQMLGAFLWGKKAECRLLATADDGLTASVKGLSGVTHTRRWRLEARGVTAMTPQGDSVGCMPPMATLTVADTFDKDCRWEATMIVAPGLEVTVSAPDRADIGGLLSLRSSSGAISTDIVEIATGYGRLAKTTAIRIVGDSRENIVTLQSL